ncbi:MAG: hypothetical protein K2O65_09010 [Lachnospiraceae bacterium]|nr:hypothetical protein [Lachnospiraceae bacterium]
MRMANKLIRFIVPLLLVLIFSIITNVPHRTLAAELPQNEPNRNAVDIDILQLKENLTEGMLEIPEDVQRKIILYQWIMGGVEQYVAETGIKDVFSCDLENDLLYGDREFFLAEAQRAEWDKYAYLINNETGLDMKQESYKLMLQGVEHTLYVDVNIKEGKVCVYLKGYGPAVRTVGGNSATYKLIENDDDGQIIYYPDIYVESDWDDLEICDNHLGEVSFGELHELSFLKIPEDIGASERYFNVASALKRYVEENQIEDVFYFDAEQDVICQVTNMIYTCRVRGNTMTLYIDIDGYNMKAHVYQVED